MKKEISVFDYGDTILKAVKRGVLMTVKADGQVNPMTISWGTIGVQWNKPIFIVFVRKSRHTKTLLDKNPEFTVNIPLDGDVKHILAFCGTRSGRDLDKVKELDLTLEEPATISVPGIRELPLTLECRVVYRQPQDLGLLNPALRDGCYPELEDFHTAYYGEITAAYIIE